MAPWGMATGAFRSRACMPHAASRGVGPGGGGGRAGATGVLERQMESSRGQGFGRGRAGSGVAGGHAVELQAQLWGAAPALADAAPC